MGRRVTETSLMITELRFHEKNSNQFSIDFLWIVPLILFVTRGTEMLSNACQRLRNNYQNKFLFSVGSMWYVGRGVRCDQGD